MQLQTDQTTDLEAKYSEAYGEYIRAVIEKTGRRDWLDECQRLHDEQEDLRTSLSDSAITKEPDKLDEIEYRVVLGDAECRGQVYLQRAILSKALGLLTRPKRYLEKGAQERATRFLQTSRALERTLVGLRRISGSNDEEGPSDKPNTSNDKAIADLVIETDVHLRREIERGIRQTLNRINKEWRRYCRNRICSQALQRWNYIFWSLIIFTLLVGFLVDRIEAKYLSLGFVPIVIWVLQKAFLDKWLESRQVRLRRRYLRQSIDSIWDLRQWLVIFAVTAEDDLAQVMEIHKRAKPD